MSKPFPYVGRFAPTPSGPLHFGSIIAALGSFLDIRSHAGRWLVRIDDLDSPRVQVIASESILPTLERFGLHWNEPIVYQSHHNEAYLAVIDKLEQQGYYTPVPYPSKLTKGLPYPGLVVIKTGM